MTILAFDYGRRKVGVALATGPLAEPLLVIREKTRRELVSKAADIVLLEKPELLLVGISENEIAMEAQTFGDELSLLTRVKVKYVDETLSTFDAQQLAIASNMRRKKRQELEDAFSAAVILQRYLDSL